MFLSNLFEKNSKLLTFDR